MDGKLRNASVKIRLNQTLQLALVSACDEALLLGFTAWRSNEKNPCEFTLIMHVVLIGCYFTCLIDHFQVLHVNALRICTNNAKLELVFRLFISLLLLRVVDESDVLVVCPVLLTQLWINWVLRDWPESRYAESRDVTILANHGESFILLCKHD